MFDFYMLGLGHDQARRMNIYREMIVRYVLTPVVFELRTEITLVVAAGGIGTGCNVRGQPGSFIPKWYCGEW